jgi:hypothetical protein
VPNPMRFSLPRSSRPRLGNRSNTAITKLKPRSDTITWRQERAVTKGTPRMDLFFDRPGRREAAGFAGGTASTAEFGARLESCGALTDSQP